MKKYVLFVLLTIFFDWNLIIITPFFEKHLFFIGESLTKGIIGFSISVIILFYILLKYYQVFFKKKQLTIGEHFFVILSYPCMEAHLLLMTIYGIREMESISGLNYIFGPFAIVFFIISPFVVCLPLIKRSRRNGAIQKDKLNN